MRVGLFQGLIFYGIILTCYIPSGVLCASSSSNTVENVCSATGVPSCQCAVMADHTLRVDCSSRQLTDVPDKIPSYVSLLLLNNNKIKSLNSSHFKAFKDLRTLYLQSNSISNIERGTFDYMYNLKSLQLGTNQLSHIYSGMFYHLPNLNTLELSNNVITKLDRDAFLTLPNIKQIGFTGNPLQCDCETRAFRQWLNARVGSVTMLNAVCKNFQDIQLTKLADNKFGNCQGGLFGTHSCFSCSDAKSHRKCVEALNSQQACTPGVNNVCYSNVKYQADGMHFWKGCMQYEVCIVREALNTQGCYGPDPPLSCIFCCLGDYCNANALGNRTKVLQYLVTFTLMANMTPGLSDLNSLAYKTFSASVTNELTNAVQYLNGYNGTYIFSVQLISGPYTTMAILLECTTIVETDNLKIQQHVINTLNMLTIINGLRVKAGSLRVSVADTNSCPKETISTSQGTYEWLPAAVGTTSVLPCAGQSVIGPNYATRQCLRISGTATWNAPDTNACEQVSTTTIMLRTLVSKPVTESNADNIATELEEVSRNSPSYTDKDFNMTVFLLEELEKLDNTYNAGSRVDNVAKSISNLLDAPIDTFKNSEEKSRSPTRLLHVIYKLSDNINLASGDFAKVTPNVALFALPAEKSQFNGMELRVESSPGSKFQQSKVTLIKNDKQINRQDTSTNIVLPGSLLDDLKQASRLTFAAYANDKLFTGIEQASGEKKIKEITDDNRTKYISKVNSQVLAASVPGVEVKNLEDFVYFTFQHTETNAENPACAFWDDSVPGASRWSTTGCAVNETFKGSHTVCACNHLTNFALLMDVYRTGGSINEANRMALSYISYIGCGISLVGLILTLITYLLFRKLRKDNPSKILINLCIALTATDLVFLVGMQNYTIQNALGCKVVAVILHYFLLSAMCWMAVEAFYMYLALVKIFNTYISRFLLKSCLVGWGIPLIIVAVTLGVNRTENYGYQAGDICWLQPIPFYAAFLAPVGIIIILNFIAFVLVMRQICGASAKILTKSDRSKTSSRLRGAVSVVILLGLTWVFAIFAADGAGIVFTYLFAIFNSLQGLFIFIFYCLLKKDAKRAWIAKCCPRFSDKDSQTSKVRSLIPAKQGTKYNKGYSSSSLPSKSFSDITKDTDDMSVSTRGPDSKNKSTNGSAVKEKGRFPSYSDSNI